MSTSVLFVCLGNICRSPMAEALFLHLVSVGGVDDRFRVASAGTGAYHVGARCHPLTRQVLTGHGIDPVARARQVTRQDFDTFDVILAMDRSNLHDLRSIAPAEPRARLALVLDPVGGGDVPDPYGGPLADYERTFALLRPALEAWVVALSAAGRRPA